MSGPRNGIRILSACFSLVLIGYAGIVANVYRHAGRKDARAADAIVVLGAAQWNGKPSPMFQARLDQAEFLYRQDIAPFIIVTGGVGKGAAVSDARAGKNYLMDAGVDERRVIIEEQSRTTWQNLNQVSVIMRGRQFDSIMLVSHDFHMMRAKSMARDLSMEAYASPVRTKNEFARLRYSLREAVVYILYILFKV